MNNDAAVIDLQEGEVDTQQEHFALGYGSASEPDTWLPTALIGPPETGICKVQYLMDRNDESKSDAVEAVKREMTFYLLEKGEQNPWLYCQYHCGTSANIYSSVHWSFHDQRS